MLAGRLLLCVSCVHLFWGSLTHNGPRISLTLFVFRNLLPPVSAFFFTPRITYPDDIQYELDWSYSGTSKLRPYVGSAIFLPQVPHKSRFYYNSLAVFPDQHKERLHGRLGVYSNGTPAYVPKPAPPPITPNTRAASLADGGFYLNLSNALPLDRKAVDARSQYCRWVTYDLDMMDDASVIITFYNEHISTLLRSVHSVLNRTPPPLLREIILVDDHSSSPSIVSGGFLDQYIPLLPKTKLLRLPERRGLVHARLAGARVASAPVLVFLDSHIEVNKGWIQPQLKRLAESPRSIVFPQIPIIKSETLDYEPNEGIGCRVGFKWSMQETSESIMYTTSSAPIQSPSMAGGIFAVKRHWFWELGGYDEEFSMWGAENVEMGFRTWMCGGQLECTPCGYVYHIYRNGGKGYSFPSFTLQKNRLRTALLWTGPFFQLAVQFIGHKNDTVVGPINHMLTLKQRLQCKNFTWYLENVDQKQPLRTLKNFLLTGQVRNVNNPLLCIDTLSNNKPGKPYGLYYCHEGGGTQGFLYMEGDPILYTVVDETLCLDTTIRLEKCADVRKKGRWELGKTGSIMWVNKEKRYKCLTYSKNNKSVEQSLTLEMCNDGDSVQLWTYSSFVPKSSFQVESELPNMRLVSDIL